MSVAHTLITVTVDHTSHSELESVTGASQEGRSLKGGRSHRAHQRDQAPGTSHQGFLGYGVIDYYSYIAIFALLISLYMRYERYIWNWNRRLQALVD